MSSLNPARRRADRFDSLLQGERAELDPRDLELLELVGALQTLPRAEARPEFVADLDVVEEMEEMDDVETIGDALDRHTVAEVMTRRVMAMPPGADAITAASRLRTADVHRVLVVDGDRLLGIVTTSDITRAVADRALVQRTYVFDGRG